MQSSSRGSGANVHCDDDNKDCRLESAGDNEMVNSTVPDQAYLVPVSDDYLSTIFNNGWTQQDLLFDGAFKCAASGNFDNGLPINFAADGTPDFTCMSKLPMCFANPTCPIAPINGLCPYTACPDWGSPNTI